jgi:hypothetical protein
MARRLVELFLQGTRTIIRRSCGEYASKLPLGGQGKLTAHMFAGHDHINVVVLRDDTTEDDTIEIRSLLEPRASRDSLLSVQLDVHNHAGRRACFPEQWRILEEHCPLRSAIYEEVLRELDALFASQAGAFGARTDTRHRRW